jgi:poly(glycerol-phosphate) alpha-glucosyltransferase
MGRRLGLQDNLVVADPAYGKEKWEILASADVFVHVSRWEASPPIAVLEAMAVGLPCLLSAVVDPECRIENAGAALRIQPEPASIADGISLLADLPTRELRFMGWRARHVVREDFCWERTAQILLNAYEHWR